MPSNDAGTSCSRTRSIARVAVASLPLPTVGIVTAATVPSLLVSTSTGPLTCGSASALRTSSCTAPATRAGGDVIGLDHHVCSGCFAREGGGDAVVGLHDRDIPRQVLGAADLHLQRRCRDRQGDQEAGRNSQRARRAAHQ